MVTSSGPWSRGVKIGTLVLSGMLVATTAFGADLTVGLVLDKGGKDDKSFNAAAYEGLKKAEKELKIKMKAVEAPDDNAFEQLLSKFARDGKYQLIIGVGFAQTDAMKKVSAQFPKVSFAIIDSKVDNPNVRSLLFEEHEGSFLVGAIAGLTSKTGKIGFIGGMDIPLIRRFQMGYEAGGKHVKPSLQVTSNYIGVTGDAWKDPGKAKELALSQYSGGVDVVFHAAGGSGMGVFDAAEEKKKLAIGCDSNQDWVKPGFVLTSMLKRVDVAVFDTVKMTKEGKFSGGVASYGLKNNGVGYSVDEYNKKLLSPDVLKKVEAIKADIIAGKITVPDYYKTAGRK